MNYDAVILSHPKDYNKLVYCLESLSYLKPYPENIYVVSPHKHEFNGIDVTSIQDHEALEITFEDIKYKRPFWIFQQLLGLYQDFTENDLYMVIDGDIMFNRDIKFSGKTFFLSDREQWHKPYFNFMKDYFNLVPNFDKTFINDFMLFDKEILRKFMPDLKDFVKDLNHWLQDENYLLADYELYGHWVYNNMPGEYTLKPTKQKMFGQFDMWRDEHIKLIVETCKELDIDLLSIHTWT